MLSKYRVYCYDHLEAPAVTAGTNAVLIGAQNGLFPDMGHAVPGEMGGLWAGEKKVCDGFFFAIDDVPLTSADACEKHPAWTAFHYRMQKEALHVVRRQIIPDGVKGCVIELTIENQTSVPRMVEVSFTVRTEIMTVSAARGVDGMELGRDVAEYDEKSQAFYARDSRNPWHAVWGADTGCRVLQADLPHDVYGFGTTLGKGVNGRMFYRMRVAANGQAKMRLFVAGGFASRTQAEDVLELLRKDADRLIEEKESRLCALLEESEASLPDMALERSWNWQRIYGDWLTRCLPQGGMGLCSDLPEHPSLFGEGWAQALGALLPLSGGERVQEVLRALVRISEETQTAAGRLPKRISRSGRILEVGGVKDSAQFVALVHKTLRFTGDKDFANDMLSMCGLCVNYLRRSTRGFEDVREDLMDDLRPALEGYVYLLNLLGANSTEYAEIAARLPVRAEVEPSAENGPARAAWHGRQGHVERMIGRLVVMAKAGAAGMPGVMRSSEPGVLFAAKDMANLVWPVFESLFGVRPDAGEKTIVFAPHTPIGWDGWQIENVAIGGAHFDFKAERISPSKVRYSVMATADGWTLVTSENGEENRRALDGMLTVEMGD